jgi:hypothetical protein
LASLSSEAGRRGPHSPFSFPGPRWCRAHTNGMRGLAVCLGGALPEVFGAESCRSRAPGGASKRHRAIASARCDRFPREPSSAYRAAGALDRSFPISRSGSWRPSSPRGRPRRHGCEGAARRGDSEKKVFWIHAPRGLSTGLDLLMG